MNSVSICRVLSPQEYENFPDLLDDIREDNLKPVEQFVAEFPQYIDVQMKWFHGNMLMAAAYNGSINTLRFLLKKGANPELGNQQKITALMLAAMDNRYEVVKYLLEFGVNANQSNEAGYSALIEAVKSNRIEIVQLLLDHGADINQRSVVGETSLLIASFWCHEACVRLLLERGANRHLADQRGSLPDAVPCLFLWDKSKEDSLRQLIQSFD